MLKQLKVEQLRASCDPEIFSFTTTAEVKNYTEGIIGQNRAVKAMDFGLKVEQKGYNIYMAGITGTGKTTYAKALIAEEAKEEEKPADWCYIYNFNEPEKPQALCLPAGVGCNLKVDMEKLIEELKGDIPKIFESEEFEGQRNKIMEKYQGLSREILEGFENELGQDGFMLQRTGKGILTVPLVDGEPMKQEDLQNMDSEERKAFQEKTREIQGEMDDVMRKIRNLEIKARKEIERLEEKAALSVVKPVINHLREQYEEYQGIINYLEAVQDDIIKHLEYFKREEEDKEEALLNALRMPRDESFFTRYQVNLLVNNAEVDGAPVVFETNPTYYNLFGKIEGKSQFGTVTTDFTMIRSGAIHRSNGGYLILQARDILTNPYSWETLKRTLGNEEIRVENIGEQFRTIPITTLKPEPIPLDLKVILIGDPLIYQLLYHYDPDFKKLFKIKAHFDDSMERDEENVNKFASFIAALCQREGLKHFNAGAVARVIDYSSKLAGSKDKLTARFNEIVEILYEANTWAELAGSDTVERSHVQKAIREKIYRSNLGEERLQDMIDRNKILVDTEGSAAGQINGLSVYRTGDYSFGRPTRITARTYLGKKGVVNIEREADMSGKIHNKAVLILSGYLGGRYAAEYPLSLSATLAFEQSYGGVEGDSASCAELIVLLSAISGLPIRQDLAITGSMNQWGKVQPIGGVNQKIEGFYKVCQGRGLTGEQGVVIPAQNVEDLMLDEEVIAAVEAGDFRIYAVEEIDGAIELMLGLDAEKVHEQVNARLARMAEEAERYLSGEKDGEK
ncbi:MAG: ATP-binding protein [Halanaerobium sp.]|nr:ATP-binding protein [Halanaerobium sp.]